MSLADFIRIHILQPRTPSINRQRPGATIEIGERTYVSCGASIACADRVTIGSDVLIASGVVIVDNDGHSTDGEHRKDDAGTIGAVCDWNHVHVAAVTIGDKAWIGTNAIILKGVTIGEGAIVGAGSVVTRDVPPWTVAAGNPARVIRELPR